jgi:hypothetical protein
MIKDYFASKGWLTRYAQAEDSRGMWQKYVDEVEAERVQESRTMFGQGSSVDSAVRTIDPVQDSGNKIEEVLKAYELYIKNRPGGRPMKFKTFFEEYGKENFATGGQAGQLVQNTNDGSRPGYAGKGGTNPKTGMGFQKGNTMGQGRAEDLTGKPSINVEGKNQYKVKTTKEIQAIIDANPDYMTPKNFYQPTDKMEKKGMKKLLTLTDTENPDVIFQKKGKDPADPEKQTARNTKRNESILRQEGRNYNVKAPKGYQIHHMLPLAGNVDINTGDLAVISKEMNAKMSKYDKIINKLTTEASLLDFSKKNSLNRLDDINEQLNSVLKTIKKDLPKKYKGLIGFNKLTPVFDEYGTVLNLTAKPVGIDYKKSIQGSKGVPTRDVKTSDIQKLVNEAPKSDLKNLMKSLENDLVALCPRGGKSSGGRIGFSLGSGAACGAKFLEARLKDGKGLPVQRKLMANIIATGAGIKNFAKSALNPLELLNPKNYLGPQAIALMGAYEVGDIGYNAINNNKPIKEALGDNWILKYAFPYNQEEEQVKAVEAKNISGSPAMQTYMKKVKLQAEFERENKKLEKLKKDTPSKNNPKVQEQIKEQQAVVDNLKNNWQQFVTDSTVDVNGEKVLTLESGKQDFEQAFGQIIEKRGAGEYVPPVSENSFKLSGQRQINTEGKYINTAADWIDQGDPLSYKYKKDLGKDQGRNLSETEREAEKLFPFETGSIKADYTPSTYKNLNYTPQKLPTEIRHDYENLATEKGILDPSYPPRSSLSQTPMPDGSTYDYLKDLTELYNNSQKAKQASMYPGYGGTQEPAKYAEGGLANLMKKYYDKR